MRGIASVVFGIASSIALCIAAVWVASTVTANSDAHQFTGLSTPDLWTTKPVKVDRSAQNYERLPAVLTTYAANQAKVRAVAQAAAPVVAAAQIEQVPSPEHLSWCAGQYRSFNAETNNYRSFSGEMRPCVSPFDSQEPVALSEAPGLHQAQSAAAPSIASWCAARYQSYRAEDNTYQPYRGRRRTCEGPRMSDQVASRF